jgi:hypothetical protein
MSLKKLKMVETPEYFFSSSSDTIYYCSSWIKSKNYLL